MMDNRFADKFKLKSSRLTNWDYSIPGYYFITICTYNHNNFFGKIINNKMELSKMGIIANQCLINIPKHFSNVNLDEYVVMPNHVHILIHVETPYMASLLINKNDIQTNKLNKTNNLNQIKCNLVETPCMASLHDNQKVTLINYSHKNYPNYYPRLNQKSKQLIPKIIQQFKSAVTRQINPKTVFFAWQPRFHDQIIKDEKELLMIKNYIINNPINWEKDKFYKKK
jgi:REP element-mobilizing transposase RayT